MRGAAVLLALSLAVPAHAQQRGAVPSAPPTVPPPVFLPMPPLSPQPAGGLTTPVPQPVTQPRDLYRAPNDRVFDSRLRRFVPGGGFFAPYVAPPAPTTVIVVPQPMPAEQPAERPREIAPAAPPVRPTGPTKIYIIPNCYMGNLPPRAERLPKGCDIKRVRIIDK